MQVYVTTGDTKIIDVLVVEAPPFLMVVNAATELLSAERLTAGAVSETDLSWPDFRGPFGDGGGDGLVCSDETECFGWWRRRVFPGSLNDISLRTALGLSVPENNWK